MVVSLIGWHMAGWLGVMVTSLAKFGPSSLLAGVALQVWDRFRDRPWRRVVQAGLVPVTAGLVCSSAAIITAASAQSWSLAVIAVGGAVIMTVTKIHPLLVLAAGAVVGLTGVGQM